MSTLGGQVAFTLHLAAARAVRCLPADTSRQCAVGRCSRSRRARRESGPGYSVIAPRSGVEPRPATERSEDPLRSPRGGGQLLSQSRPALILGTLNRVTGDDEFDDDIDGVPHFMQIPIDWVGDYGRLVVLGGRIEFAAYAIAATLGVPPAASGRTGAFSRVCKTILQRVDSAPPITRMEIDDWAERTRAWATTAPQVMDEYRNYHFHSLTLMQSDGERWVPSRVERHNDFDTVRPLEREELRRAVREMLAVDKEGTALWSIAPPLFLISPAVTGKGDLSALYEVRAP